MSVLVVGGRGNMGMRYHAVLNYLGVAHELVDKECTMPEIRSKAERSSGIIVSTPTYTHVEILNNLFDLKKPILCEKPLATDVVAFGRLTNDMKRARTNLTMVYQYSSLTSARGEYGFYDYFKHGGDGLVWDCIQIIALSSGNCVLREESPVWKCKIGKDTLNIADMDMAYVNFIKSWLRDPGQDLDWLFDVHVETSRMQRNYERQISSHSGNPSQDHKH